MMSKDPKEQNEAGEILTVACVREKALADPDSFVDHMRFFRSVINAPFKTTSQDLTEALRFIVFCQFSTVPAAANKQHARDFHSAYSDPAVLLEMIAKQSKSFLVSAESQVGTHTAKIPNPSVESPTALFASKEVFAAAAAESRISTASISSGQRIGAAGNAALGKTQRLLATRLEIDGVLIDIVDDIAAGGAVSKALVQVGFAPEVIESASEILKGRVSDFERQQTPGSGTKQLLWPTEDGDVVITPVHAYAMHVELARRIGLRQQAGSIIDTTFVVVGGTQPQNAGLINGDMGGRHRMLKGAPPVTESSEVRAAYRAAQRGELEFGRASTEAVNALVKSVKASYRDNRIARRQLETIIRQVIVGLAMPFIRYRDNTWHDEISAEKIKFPKWSAPLLTHGFDGIGERKSKLLGDVSRKVVGYIPVEHLGAANDVSDLIGVIEKVAGEFFGDVFKGGLQ